jgi:hypothetical protein
MCGLSCIVHCFVDVDEARVDEALRHAGVPPGDRRCLTPEAKAALLSAGFVIRSEIDERTGQIETRVLAEKAC